MLWPLGDGFGAQPSADLATSSGPVTVTASATPHTAGPWVEMIPATNRDYGETNLILQDTLAQSATNTSTLVDIGVGGSGSESVLVSSIGIGHAGAGRLVRLPLRITAGARLSVRIRSAVVSKAAELALILTSAGGWNPPETGARATTYGALTAASAGTDMALPAAVNTKGAWTEIAATTSAPIRWLVPLVVGNSTDTAWVANHRGLIDIGVGGSGAEQVIVPNIGFGAFNNEAILHFPVTVPVRVPAGTRLTARYQEALLGDRPGIILIGVD